MDETTLKGLMKIFILSEVNLEKVKIILQENVPLNEEVFILLCHFAVILDAICLMVDTYTEEETTFDYAQFMNLIQTASEIEGDINDVSSVLTLH